MIRQLPIDLYFDMNGSVHLHLSHELLFVARAVLGPYYVQVDSFAEC